MLSYSLRICVSMAALAILSCAYADNPATIYLADFLSPSEAMTDAAPSIRAALDAAKSQNADKLILPGGTLHVRPEKAYEKYRFISNNDESLKRIAFDLEGFDGFTIEGNGTQLIFTGFMSPFNIENCNNVVIENLSIDFTRPFHSEGTIVNVFEGGYDITFADDYGANLHNGILRFSDSEGRTYPYGSMLEFDADKREPAYYAQDIWLWGGIQATKNADGSYRFLGKDKVGTVGNTVVFGALHRYNPAFTLADCSDIKLQNITVLHCGGMGVIAQRCRDLELNRVNLEPSEGRMISATADATHFVNCAGYLRMTDCTFRNQKDDATNIHGLYMAVDSVLAADRMMVRWHNSGQYGVDFITPGMTLELVDNEDMTTYARRKVKDVNRLNKVFTEVTFTEPLPDQVRKMHVVAADDEYPEVLIKDCRFSGNRARGLLLGSRAPIVVENCYFHVPGAAILFEGDGNYWWEQSGVRDVTIRNNIFDNCNYGSPSWGSACIAVGSGIPKRNTCRYHKNIKVEGNTFRIFDPRIVNLYCVDGFEFTPDNKIEKTGDYVYGRKEQRNFVSEDSDNVNIIAQ